MDKKESVELVIEETSGIDRVGEPVTVGIPFPKGMLKGENYLSLFDSKGNQVPLQKQIMSQWPDLSLKWVLLDFLVDCYPASTSSYNLKFQSLPSDQYLSSDKINITDGDSFLSIDTGKAIFILDKKTFSPFQSVTVSGAEIIDASNSNVRLTDENQVEYIPIIRNISIETSGLMRSTIRIDGYFESGERKVFCDFFARLFFYAGKSLTKIDFTIRNPKAASHPGGLWDLGDDGSVYFDDFSFQLGLAEKNDTSIFWKTGTDREINALNGNRVKIYQDSSGGENWDSPNHVNREGEIRNSFRGYRVTTDNLLEEGYRASPVIAVASGSGKISAAIQKFWQNSPKSVEAGNSVITLGIFPKQYNDIFELQGGEQKTHTVYIEFGAGDNESLNLDWIHEPLVPRVSPEWYSQCGVPGYISPEKIDRNPGYMALVSNVIEGDNNFFNLREKIDEYGWRNFGEVFASHEYAGYEGSSPLFVSHYNNQYDIIMGCLLQYARSGEPRWYQLMNDLARHIIDIDIYHTKEDRPGYSGGYFWHTDHFIHAETATHRSYSKKNADTGGVNSYGGGPSPEHCYTTGLAMYYYITGDVMAKETVIILADWIMNEKRVQKSIAGVLRKAKQILFAYFDEYSTAPGRAEANSVNALLDAFELSRDRKYLLRVEKIIRNFMSPNDNINKLNQQQIERRWFYLIFLQSLGKYLDVKDDMDERDGMFDYARKCLMHHAKWMLENEVPYKQLFHLVEIPSSTWPAHDIRKSAIFDFAYKYGQDHLKGEFKAKAEFFYSKSIEDVMSFEDGSRTFVRPLAILMHYGVMHTYFQNMTNEHGIDENA